MAFGLKYDSIENYLKSYGKYIVRQARGILKKHNASGKLSKSLKYKVIKDSDGFDIKFYASKYSAYINKGVSGTRKKRYFTDKDGKRKLSPFSYKNSKGHSQPPSSALDKWTIRKGLAPRSKGGQFVSRKSLNYIIARSIGRKGIPALSFYTQPLSYSYNVFKKEMIKHFKEDVLKNVKTVSKNWKR